jgi:hypothetical protein
MSSLVLVGAIGAVVCGAVLIRLRDELHAHLIRIPTKYRRFVAMEATSIGVASVTDFIVALTLTLTLHPPLWNSLRFVMSGALGATLILATALAIPRKTKRLRDRQFDTFWTHLNFAELSHSIFVSPELGAVVRQRRIHRGDRDHPFKGVH